MSFFLTKWGKITSRAIAVTVTTGIAITPLLPNIFTEKYMNFQGLYKRGALYPVPMAVKQLVDEVQNDIEYTPLKKRKVTVFMNNGVMVTVKGLMNLVNAGYVIGIPKTFLAERSIDLLTQNLQFRDIQIDWDSYESQKFKETLIQSRASQKWCIAEQIQYIHTMSYILSTIVLTSILCNNVVQCCFFNTKYNLLAKPFYHRVPMYALSTAFFGAIGVIFFGWRKRVAEEHSIRRVASLSAEYRNGGIEYYRKCIVRNIQFRKLVPTTYFVNEEGEETFLARRLTLSVKERLEILEDSMVYA